MPENIICLKDFSKICVDWYGFVRIGKARIYLSGFVRIGDAQALCAVALGPPSWVQVMCDTPQPAWMFFSMHASGLLLPTIILVSHL